MQCVPPLVQDGKGVQLDTEEALRLLTLSLQLHQVAALPCALQPPAHPAHWQAARGHNHPDTAAALNNLAQLHQAVGNPQATSPWHHPKAAPGITPRQPLASPQGSCQHRSDLRQHLLECP